MKRKKSLQIRRQVDRFMPVVSRYRMLILFFVLLVGAGVFCGSAFAYDDIQYAQNLSDALNISVTGAAYANGDTVYLIKDVPLDYTINITAASPITLTTVDNDHTIFRSVSNVPLFNVSSGTLILQGNGGKNLTIDGNKTAYDMDGYSLIYVNGGGLNMSDGAVLQNSNTSNNGSGVSVKNSGTFNMTGGNISGNNARYGGGVEVMSGTFNMTGGTISDNSASIGGGVYVVSGTFNMTGGTISGNTTYLGGGVYLWGGTFTMTGGTISNNNAADSGGGVYVESGTFTMTGGTISGNTTYLGGGVYLSEGTSTMTGGTISDNSADYGGGVYILFFSTFNMTGGTISNNNATYFGGGVYIWGGIFTMTGGTISGNTAYRGGGVYLNLGTFTMTGGAISDNSAGNTGGGVYLDLGTFNMTGGTISGNTAIDGGGVYVHAYDYNTFNMTGSATVDTNNDVYLDLGQSITVTGALDPSAGARNITPAYNTSGNTVVEYGSVDIQNWSFNFALNTTWIQENQMDLAQSGTNLSLSNNFTVKYYLTDSNTTPYITNTSVPYDATLSQPGNPTRTGYTFSSWNQESSSGIPWNFTTDTVKANTYLYACWTENPTSSSGDGGNDGNNADYGPVSPNGTFTTEDGNLTLHYPAGSSVIVTVFKDYFNGATAPSGVLYLNVYDVHSTADSGTPVTLVFNIAASELERMNLTSNDIAILHYYDGEWHQMTITSIELVDGVYQFTVTSTHTSPFMIAYNVDGTWVKLEETSTPTSTPTTGSTEIVPTSTTTPTPTEAASSPVPLVGIIAGLGAAGLLLRRR